MNKQHKILGIIAGMFFLFALCYNGIINRISKEQKTYELSVIWKELKELKKE